jgi:peptidoglycan hydrolase-like protein with peptidoglycan-binding domain
MPELSPMSGTEICWVGKKDDQVLSVEQRLSLLGFFGGTPDETFDEHTLYAVNSLRKFFGLSETPVCGETSLKLINLAVQTIASSTVTVDNQFDYALKLVKSGW